MSDNNLKIIIDLENKGKGDAADITKALDDIQKAAINVGTAGVSTTKSLDQLSPAFAQVTEAASKLDKILGSDFLGSGSAIDSINAKFKDLKSISDEALRDLAPKIQEARIAFDEFKKTGNDANLFAKLQEINKSLDFTKTTQSLDAFKSKLPGLGDGLEKIFGTEQAGKFAQSVESATSSLGGLAGVAGPAALAVAGVEAAYEALKSIISEVKAGIESIAENNRKIIDISNATGASRESIATLGREYEKLGKSVDDVRLGLGKFEGFISKALKDPSSEAAIQAKQLGINLEALANTAQPVDLALRQVATSTKGVTHNIEESGAAVAAFGQRAFVPALKALKDFDEKLKETQEKGILLTPEQSENASKFTALINTIASDIQGLVTQTLAPLFPIINEGLTTVEGALGRLDKESVHRLTEGLSTIGDLIVRLLPGVIGIGNTALNIIGRVSETFSFLVSTLITGPLDILKTALIGSTEDVKVLGDTAEQAAPKFDKLGRSIAEFQNSLKNTKTEQENATKLLKIELDKQILAAEDAARSGLITSAEASKRKVQYEEEYTSKVLDNAERQRQSFDLLKNTEEFSLTQKITKAQEASKAAVEALEKESLASQGIIVKKERLFNEYLDFQKQGYADTEERLKNFTEKDEIDYRAALDRKTNAKRFATAEEKQAEFNDNADRAKILKQYEIDEKASLERDLAEYKKTLEEKRKAFIEADPGEKVGGKGAALRAVEIKANEDLRKSEEELAQFKKAINIKEVVDLNTLTETQKKLRQEAFSVVEATDKAELASDKNKSDQKIASANEAKEAEVAAIKVTDNLALQSAVSAKKQFADKKITAIELAAELRKIEIDKLNNEISDHEKGLEDLRKTGNLEKALQADKEAQIRTLRANVVDLTQKDKDATRAVELQKDLAAIETTIQAEKLGVEASKRDLKEKAIIQGSSLDIEKQRIDLANQAIKEARLATDELRASLEAKEKTLAADLASGKTLDQEVTLLKEIRQLRSDIKDKVVDEEKALKDKQNASLAATTASIDAFDAENQGALAATQSVANNAQAAGLLGEKLKEIADAFKVTFDPKNFDPKSIATAREELQKYQQALQETEDTMLKVVGFGDVLLNAQKVQIEGSIEELTKRIAEADRAAFVDAAQKAAAAALAIRQKEVDGLVTLVESSLDKEAQLERKHDRAVRDIKAEAYKDAVNEAVALSQAVATEAQKEQDLKKQFAEEDAKARKQEEQDVIRSKQTTLDALANLESANRSKNLKGESDAIVTISKERKKLADLEKELASETDPTGNKQKALKDQIDAEKALIDGATTAEAQRKQREKDKASELAKAEADFKSKITKDTTKEQLELAQKELDATKQNIDDKYSAQEDYENKLLDLQKNGDAEGIKELQENYAKSQEELKNHLAEQKQQFQTDFDFQKTLRDQATAEQKTARDKQLTDLQSSLKDQLDAIKKQYDDQVTALNDKLEKEKKSFFEAQKKIDDALKTAIASSDTDIQALFSNIAKGSKLSSDALNTLLTSLKALQDQAKAGVNVPGGGEGAGGAGGTGGTGAGAGGGGLLNGAGGGTGGGGGGVGVGASGSPSGGTPGGGTPGGGTPGGGTPSGGDTGSGGNTLPSGIGATKAGDRGSGGRSKSGGTGEQSASTDKKRVSFPLSPKSSRDGICDDLSSLTSFLGKLGKPAPGFIGPTNEKSKAFYADFQGYLQSSLSSIDILYRSGDVGPDGFGRTEGTTTVATVNGKSYGSSVQGIAGNLTGYLQNDDQVGYERNLAYYSTLILNAPTRKSLLEADGGDGGGGSLDKGGNSTGGIGGATQGTGGGDFNGGTTSRTVVTGGTGSTGATKGGAGDGGAATPVNDNDGNAVARAHAAQGFSADAFGDDPNAAGFKTPSNREKAGGTSGSGTGGNDPSLGSPGQNAGAGRDGGVSTSSSGSTTGSGGAGATSSDPADQIIDAYKKYLAGTLPAQAVKDTINFIYDKGQIKVGTAQSLLLLLQGAVLNKTSLGDFSKAVSDLIARDKQQGSGVPAGGGGDSSGSGAGVSATANSGGLRGPSVGGGGSAATSAGGGNGGQTINLYFTINGGGDDVFAKKVASEAVKQLKSAQTATAQRQLGGLAVI